MEREGVRAILWKRQNRTISYKQNSAPDTGTKFRNLNCNFIAIKNKNIEIVRERRYFMCFKDLKY